jgi:DNA-binding MarR family transcriptional regulator
MRALCCNVVVYTTFFYWDSESPVSNRPAEVEQPTLIPCLCAQTRRVDRLLNRIYDDALRPLGINTMQKSLLTSIGRFPEGIDTAILCQRLALDRSTLTRNLTMLQQMGFVAVSANELDRRKRTATLTDSGRATEAASEPLWSEAQRQVVEAVGLDRAVEMTTLLADVERIVRELDS